MKIVALSFFLFLAPLLSFTGPTVAPASNIPSEPGKPAPEALVSDTLAIDTMICAGLPFILPDGSEYPYQPGLNQDTLARPSGMDTTIVLLSLEVLEPSYTLISEESCPGDTLFIGGQPFTADTAWTDVLAAANGCDSIVEMQLRFPNPGYAIQTDIPGQLCRGESLQVIYGLDLFSRLEFPFTAQRSDSLPLPDGVGASYSTSININSFPEGAVVESAEDIEACINMEHSWMYDLDIAMRCPNGTIIPLQEQEFITNEVHLGIPFEGDDSNIGPVPIPGQGYTYCWVAGASAGSWTEFVQANDPGGAVEFTLPAGQYAPAGSFDALVGCPWNGEWTIEVTDRWASDNGYVFFWSVGSRNVQPDTAAVVSRGWVENPAATISGDTLSFTAGQAGAYHFTYALEDTSGCIYDTTLTVEVLPEYLQMQDIQLCPGGQLHGMTVDTPGVYTAILATVEGCDSTILYQVSLLETDTTRFSSSTCIAGEAGIFTEILVNENGCDSIILTEVQYLPPSDTTVVMRYTCNSAQEDEYLVLEGAGGCDSIVFTGYNYAPLNYSLAVTPDTCQAGAGGLEVQLLDNPYYNAVSFSLYRTMPLTLIGSGQSFSSLSAGTYRLEGQAGDHCEIAEQVEVPDAGGSPPEATFFFDFNADFSNAAFTADPVAGEQPAYNWAFGDGSNGSGPEVDHEYPYAGSYEACLAAENECGQDVQCMEVFLPLRMEAVGGGGQMGGQLALPVMTNGAFQLGYLEGAIWFLSPEVIQLDSLAPVALSASGDFGYEIIDNLGYITFDWAAAGPPGITAERSDTLFLIHLTLAGQPGERSTITIPDPPAASYYQDGQELVQYDVVFIDSEVIVETANSAEDEPGAAGLRLFQNWPNPFERETAIPFFLPRSSEVELLVTDPLGRTVERHAQYYPAGRHAYVFRPESRQAAGFYSYTLRTNYSFAARRMVLAH